MRDHLNIAPLMRGAPILYVKMQQNRYSSFEGDGSVSMAVSNVRAHFLDQNRPTRPDGDKDDQ